MTSHEYGCDAGYVACERISPARPYGWLSHALPALVLHDVALRVELREIERVEQEAHAIGFEPQRRLEIVRRDGLVVRRPIVRGRAVVGAADALGELVVQAVGHVAGTGEHHVLEQVREAGAAGHLVLRADVIPDVDRDRRRRVILREDDREPVRQRVTLERNVDGAWPVRRCTGNQDGECQQRDLSAELQHGRYPFVGPISELYR